MLCPRSVGFGAGRPRPSRRAASRIHRSRSASRWVGGRVVDHCLRRLEQFCWRSLRPSVGAGAGIGFGDGLVRASVSARVLPLERFLLPSEETVDFQALSPLPETQGRALLGQPLNALAGPLDAFLGARDLGRHHLSPARGHPLPELLEGAVFSRPRGRAGFARSIRATRCRTWRRRYVGSGRCNPIRGRGRRRRGRRTGRPSRPARRAR